MGRPSRTIRTSGRYGRCRTRWRRRDGGPERAARRLVTVAVVMLFAVMTYARNHDYESFDRIWLDTIEKRPQNARARINYSSALLDQHRYREAEQHLRAAVGI